MRKETIYSLLLVAATAAALWGCGKQPALSNEEQQKDYREMINRARDRQGLQIKMDTLYGGIRSFQRDIGRNPTNLQELVRHKYLDNIPPAPDGQDFHYDFVHGSVRLIRRRQ